MAGKLLHVRVAGVLFADPGRFHRHHDQSHNPKGRAPNKLRNCSYFSTAASPLILRIPLVRCLTYSDGLTDNYLVNIKIIDYQILERFNQLRPHISRCFAADGAKCGGGRWSVVSGQKC